MKTKAKIILPMILLLASGAAIKAQTISSPTISRDAIDFLYSFDSDYGPYASPNPGAATNDFGAFHFDDPETTPAGNGYCIAQTRGFQDSMISISSNNLSATGQLFCSASGSAVQADQNSGSVSWQIYSRFNLGFGIDKPFQYSLSATTSESTNSVELNPDAFIYFGHANSGSPDVAAFGRSHTYHYIAPDSGTNSGILPAGGYEFHVLAQADSGVAPSSSPASENMTVSFTLNIIPLSKPVIVSFNQNGGGAYQMIWNASAAGNYRISSSTNLLTWSDYLSTTNYSSGSNTNLVNSLPGAAAGFFRVEYLP